MLKCLRCNKTFDDEELVWQCSRCRGPLEYISNERSFFRKKKILLNPHNMWRYSDALSIQDKSKFVSLGEGMTPLIKSNWDEREMLFKLDYIFPTGSFKDRGMSFLITKLKELGIKEVIEDSSGNAGSSMAAYCSRSNIKCNIFVPENTSVGKILQMKIFGAKVHKIPGSREKTSQSAINAAGKVYYASHNWSPYFLHGIKTMAFELWEQLNWGIPDNIIIPIGEGSLALGLYLGFNELLNDNQVNNIPRIFGVQSENCDPLKKAFQKNLDEPFPIQKKNTIAEGISSSNPIKGKEVLFLIKKTKGKIISVSENEIWDGLKKLARQGFFVEPTSATVGCGLSKLIKNNDIDIDSRTVVVLTGSGLKTIDTIINK